MITPQRILSLFNKAFCTIRMQSKESTFSFKQSLIVFFYFQISSYKVSGIYWTYYIDPCHEFYEYGCTDATVSMPINILFVLYVSIIQLKVHKHLLQSSWCYCKGFPNIVSRDLWSEVCCELVTDCSVSSSFVFTLSDIFLSSLITHLKPYF